MVRAEKNFEEFTEGNRTANRHQTAKEKVEATSDPGDDLKTEGVGSELVEVEVRGLDPRRESVHERVEKNSVANVEKGKSSNVNNWAAKKTVAQGMMDVALMTSNANQLRYLIIFGSRSPLFGLNVALITISLMLQVAIGVALIFKRRMHLNAPKGEPHTRQSERLNGFSVVGVFLVTVINVFLSVFSITGPDPATAAAPAQPTPASLTM